MRYEGNIYRPPGEWKSYLLQVTVGCSHNACTFCGMYKDKRYRVRPLEEIFEDIAMAKAACGDVNRVFLCDGDAVAMDTADLLAVLKKLYETFPSLERVNAYAGPVSNLARTDGELKALREAESYPGPAIVICYCPCLEQHIKAGMSCTQDEMKKAVECGYWHLYRYDPRRIAEGKNPFQLDSPAPDTDKLMDFLMGENRFASLKNNFPDKADALYAKEVEDVKARYAKYKKLAEG